MKQSLNDKELPAYLHGRKASEVFLEYATPMMNIALESIDHKPSIKEIEKILRVPCCIWNMMVAETDPHNSRIKDELQQIDKILHHNIPPTADQLLHFMQQRKKTDFKQYRYYLASCEVYKKSNIEIGVRVQHMPAE